MATRALATVVLLWLVPALADVGPEVRLDDAALPGANAGGQSRPVLAEFDGGVFVVWKDYRPADAWPGLSAAVLPTGAPALQGITQVTVAPGANDSPAAACGPSVCLVAWVRDGRLYARRHAFDGSALDAAPVDLTGAEPNYNGDPSVAWEGSTFTLVFRNAGAFTKTIAEDGTIGPDEDLGITGSFDWPRLVSGPPGTLLVYAGSQGLQYRVRQGDGGFGPDVVATTRDMYFGGPTAAVGASEFLVGEVTVNPANLLVGRVAADGALVDLPMLEVVTGAPPPGALAEVAGEWLVGRAGWGGAATAVLLPDGGVSAPRDLVSSPQRVGGLALVGGADPLAGYAIGSEGTPARLALQRHLPDGGASAPLPPIPGTDAQMTPAVAFGDGGFLAVWADDTADGGLDLRGRRLDERGQPVGQALELDRGADADFAPAIAWDGRQYVLAWRHTTVAESEIFVSGVSADGQRVGPTHSVGGFISQQASPPAVAAGPNATVIVWSTWLTGGYGLVTARWVDGGVLDGAQITPGSGKEEPAIAWGAGRFAVASTDYWNDVVEVRFLDPNGELLSNPAPVTLPTGGPDVHGASIASDGARFLVVWAVKSPEPYAVLAQRIDASGELIDPAPLVLLDGRQVLRGSANLDGRPSAVFDGTQFVVTFSRLDPADGGDVVRVLLPVDGAPEPPEVVAGGPDVQTEPALAPATPGRLLLAYRTWDQTLGAPRVAARLLAAVPLGARCLDTAECVGGECGADGRCCPAGGTCPDYVFDAGVAADGGAASARRFTLGCDCSGVSGPSLALAAAALLALRRRRR